MGRASKMGQGGTMKRTTARERTIAALSELGPDELEVLAIVAEGLAKGRQSYGALNIAHDSRDFEAEALEEVRDGLVYIGAALLRRTRKAAL